MFVTSAAHPHALPPPLWHVSNGRLTVGPVPTTLVRAGFETGRISADCSLRNRAREEWRSVTTLRELRPKPVVETVSTLETLLALSESISEVLLLGLRLAMERTGSTLGVLHRFDAPRKAPILHAAWGHPLAENADMPVDAENCFRLMAESNRLALSTPEESEEAREVADRLGGIDGAAAGVATAPIYQGGRVRAMIQISRPIHGYRATDAFVLANVAKITARRLDIID